MSLLDDKAEELEKHELMMGAARGKLAVSLDLLTDALVLAGQHGVYCRSNRNPAKPATDLATIIEAINAAKQLIADSMQEIKRERESRG
jgi:hypothetical protein